MSFPSGLFVFVSVFACALGLCAAGRGAQSGADLYKANCSGCHKVDGRGIPGLVPPLAGDPVVTDADSAEQIRTVLFGKQGETINGTRYVIYMPSWAGELSDREIAAIINHERSSWGNHSPKVSPRGVASIRSDGPR
ncbi:MAG: cytochrome c [Nitrospiraceae bacterium]|nr:cytochrome c [Nitrospiraceae bacterium]MDA8090908.1 cytochrome c [Nitrospiraceae bacterium]